MFLLDTNIVSELSRKRPHQELLEWITHIGDPLAISFSAVVEIQRGIENVSTHAPEKAHRLCAWLTDVLESDILFLPMDAETARIYAVMTMVPSLECLWAPDPQSKRPRPSQDLAIAATALRYGAVVATANPRDFVRVHQVFSLPGIFDPKTATWYTLERDGGAPPASNRNVDLHKPAAA
jgi:toxin FitB